MKKIMSFVGYERCDLVYHLARHILKTEKTSHILVVDNSFSQDLILSLTRGDKESEYATYKSITFTKNRMINDHAKNTFDYILIYHGMNCNHDICNISDIVYIMTDYKPRTIELIKEFEPSKITDPYMVYFDKATKKITEESIEADMEVAAKDRYVLDLDMKDMSMYIAFLYNGTQILTDESPAYHDTLMYMLMDATGIDIKRAKKIVEK